MKCSHAWDDICRNCSHYLCFSCLNKPEMHPCIGAVQDFAPTAEEEDTLAVTFSPPNSPSPPRSPSSPTGNLGEGTPEEYRSPLQGTQSSMDEYNAFLQYFKANLPAIAQRASWHHQPTISISAAATPEPAYPTSPVQPLVLAALSPALPLPGSPSQVHPAQVLESDAVEDSDFLLASRLMTLDGASAVEDPPLPLLETSCQAPPTPAIASEEPLPLPSAASEPSDPAPATPVKEEDQDPQPRQLPPSKPSDPAPATPASEDQDRQPRLLPPPEHPDSEPSPSAATAQLKTVQPSRSSAKTAKSAKTAIGAGAGAGAGATATATTARAGGGRGGGRLSAPAPNSSLYSSSSSPPPLVSAAPQAPVASRFSARIALRAASGGGRGGGITTRLSTRIAAKRPTELKG